MDGARLVIDEPVVLTQVIGKVDGLRLDEADADTKGDLFEHVLKQIRTAGELGQFRTPRHIIRAVVAILDPKIGETCYDPAAGTAGFLAAVFDYIKLANSTPDGIETVGSTASASRAATAMRSRRPNGASCRNKPSSATTSTRRWFASPP